jgi:hypothetical protein
MVVYIPGAAPDLAGVIQWAIIDRFGIEHDITWQNTQDAFVPKGTRGLGYADVELVSEKKPFSRGNQVRYINTLPVEISLPFVVTKPTFTELSQKVATIRNWFYTGDERGLTPSYLKVIDPADEIPRKIMFYYNGGLSGNLEEGGPLFVPYVIRLYCPDADWIDVAAQEITYPQADLLGATIIGITNEGDAPAYPIFTWNGPGNRLEITNQTTGKTIKLTLNGGVFLGASDSVVIDTRPATDRTTLPVTDIAGNNLFRYVQPTSDLNMWLTPGLNQFTFLVQDTTSAATLNVQYFRRWRGVLR